MSEPRTSRGWWKPVLALAMALVLIDIGIRLNADLWERHSPDDYSARIDGCAKETRDFVIIGGSPVSEGLIPGEIKGVRFRNETLSNGYAVGLPGGTLTDMYYAVRHACPTAPKVLIYGVSMTDMNDSRNEPHGPYSIYNFSDLHDLSATRPEATSWNARKFAEGQARCIWAAFRYRHGLRMAASYALHGEVAKEAQQLRDYADAMPAGQGYAPAPWFVEARYDLRKQAKAPMAPFEFLAKYKLGSHAKYLPKLVEWCQAHNTQLVLVLMPMTQDLETKYAAEYAQFQALRPSWNWPGVVTLDTHRDRVGLTDADFADIIHLNGTGAKKLSRWVRRELEQVTEPKP
ncbi:MAG: hypothetical protein ACRC8S_11040 [Fimbriiglobus sp.]